MKTKIVLNPDLMLDGVVLQFTHRIGENSEAIGHTWVKKGATDVS